MVDPHFTSALVFRLGGQYQECNLDELTWTKGLYEQHESMSPKFDIHLGSDEGEYSNGVNSYGFWTIIANGAFNSGISQESHIWSPIHLPIHSLVTFSINHKKHGDKVTSLNLFFLWRILAPRVCCNIPYFLAQYLGGKIVSSWAGSQFLGGHFVTRFVKSYGVFISGLTRTFTCIEGNDLPLIIWSQ